jgi:hypothetical protein
MVNGGVNRSYLGLLILGMSVHVSVFIFYATNFCTEYVFLESVSYGIRPGSGSENGIST